MLNLYRISVVSGFSMLLLCSHKAEANPLPNPVKTSVRSVRPFGTKIIGYEQAQTLSYNGKAVAMGGGYEFTPDTTGLDTTILMTVEAYNPELKGWNAYAGLKMNSLGAWKNTKLVVANGKIYAATWIHGGSCNLSYLDEISKYGPIYYFISRT